MGSACGQREQDRLDPLGRGRIARPALLLPAVFALGMMLPAKSPGQPPRLASQTLHGACSSPTAEDVDWAVSRAVQHLLSTQSRRGGWSDPSLPDPDGVTALAAYALLESNAPVAGLNRAMGLLLRDADKRTILDRLFTLRLLAAAGNRKTRLQTEKIIRFLEQQQSEDGGWPLQAGGNQTHGVISYLVLQALDHAATKGYRVSKPVWKRAERGWLESQHGDGGWSLLPTVSADASAQRESSTLGGTATALAALHVIYGRQYLNAELAFNGRFKAKCGADVAQTRPIRQAMARALAWLDRRYATGKDLAPSIRSPSGDSIYSSSAYELFALPRALIPTGRWRLGTVDWYREAARSAIHEQQNDGSWGGVAATSLALAGLNQARAPLMFQKLQFGSDTDWNLDPLDIAHLTAWSGEQFQQNFSWRTVSLDADLADLRLAPILYFNGHEAPAFTEAEQHRLRAYIEDGGTVLAVACCSRQEFVSGTTDLFASLLPRWNGAPLPPDHPVWAMEHDIAPGPDCTGFSDGCRTAVFILSNGACCAWHQNRSREHRRLFALAGNIARYATFDRPLHSRLSLGLPVTRTPRAPTLSVATLQHGGDWWAEAGALDKLSRILRARQGIELSTSYPTDANEALRNGIDVLWLTGHEFASADDRAGEAIRAFVEAGGTVVASACCGREAFDKAFRVFVGDIFGEARWERIATDDPLLSGGFAPDIASTLQSMRIRRRRDGRIPPRLDWPILYGVRDGDRWAVLYSPLDLPCGIVGHSCLNCLGLQPRDARALAANLMLYAAQQSWIECHQEAERKTRRLRSGL